MKIIIENKKTGNWHTFKKGIWFLNCGKELGIMKIFYSSRGISKIRNFETANYFIKSVDEG